MPKSPHSSWNLSSRHVVLKSAPPGVVDRPEARAHRALDPSLHPQIERRERTRQSLMLDPEVLASAQADIVRSQQRDPMARRLEPLRRMPTRVLQQPDDADHGRGENRLPTRFIVEGNVAAHHRQLERATRLRDSLDGLFELPEDLRTLRGAEV